MKTAEFDYHLPAGLIAQTPVSPRHASRLMVLDREDGSIRHTQFRELGHYLHSGDILVCNDSRVIPARLLGRKVPSGGKVELLLTVKRGENQWEALTRGRRVPVGGQVEFSGIDGVGSETTLRAEVLGRTLAGTRLVRFERDIEPLLEWLGCVPLPPYIHTDLEDPERYQTIYADRDGSVAAPTAGLHFTPELMSDLRDRGIDFAFITLHIGPGTFRPVRVEEVEEHQMHSEYCQITGEAAAAANRARVAGGRVIACGTTVVRALETAAAHASEGEAEVIAPYDGWTDLFIYPGHSFQAVDAMLTNFHLPRSTLLLLVAAFTGREVLDKAYQEAIEERYRFYSLGDAMLIL